MKIKKYLLILCIILVFIGISNTVNAMKIEELYENSVVIYKNKSIVTTYISTPYNPSETKMKKELNKINKIEVKINGKTVNTIKKGNGWKRYQSFNDNFALPTIIDRTTFVRKNLKDKKLGIYLYNNKNKLIKSKISTIKSNHISKVKITEKQAIKITNEIEEADKYPVKIIKAVLKKGSFLIPYYWKVTHGVPGSTWEDDVYIDDTTGDTFDEIVDLV